METFEFKKIRWDIRPKMEQSLCRLYPAFASSINGYSSQNLLSLNTKGGFNDLLDILGSPQ
jgi:hypothetical protein